MYHPHRASPPQHQSSLIPTFNLDDDDFDPLWGSAYQPTQYTEGPSEPVEDDSPVEEVAAVKPKRKYTRRRQPIKKDDKEFVEPWTLEEEVALCKAWVHASENSVEGNGKKMSGFWTEVTWIRPKVSQFCEIYNSVKDRHQSGACDNTIYQEAEIEYRTIYRSAFALTECWKILKDHSKWRKFEMPKFLKSKKTSSKKSRTSETTSQGNSDSAHIGVDLNDEAADSEDVEVQEVRPMGRDRAKKKGSSSGARSESSVAGDPSLVDALVTKFTMVATPFFPSRKESSSEYLRIKERELELKDQRRREQEELERLKIAQRDKEL
ncbi:glutathione S-transferase T3-like protein [Tanacetum coccineum]|uniref:Glutathione S-transferase T3-like protein n=1 Tax=Tanacetum coccineum TaxID=301880 RepID=A0ABQ5HZ66_9ASTR